MATTSQINSAAARSSVFIKGKQSQHQELILGATEKLQDTILDLGKQLTISSDGIIEGPTKNWQKAQSIHQSIIKEFDVGYNSTAKKVVQDFTTANADVASNFDSLGEISKYTGTNKEMFSALRDGYYQDYLAISKTAQQKVSKAMYDHVLGGSSFSSLETSIRSALMGSNAKSATGRSLANYSKLYARDLVMNYHNDVTQIKARDLGMEYFKYTGTLMGKSRRFCRQRVGRTFSKEEIQSWNYKWAGYAGPALVFRGGYNCRHHWQPVRKKWLNDQDQSKIDSLNKLDKDGNIIKGKTDPIKKKDPVKPITKKTDPKPITKKTDPKPITKKTDPKPITKKKIPTIAELKKKKRALKKEDGYQALDKQETEINAAYMAEHEKLGKLNAVIKEEQANLIVAEAFEESDLLIDLKKQRKLIITNRTKIGGQLFKLTDEKKTYISNRIRKELEPPNNTGKIKLATDSLSTSGKKKMNTIFDDFSTMIAEDVINDVNKKGVVINHNKGTRASYSNASRTITVGGFNDKTTSFHEFGHTVEWSRPGLQKKARVFLKERTGDEALTEIYAGELGWKDEFINHYVGRYYAHGATEVISMGFEYMIEDPISFYEKDPGHFEFILKIMWGEI